jgi:hypothetical protein
MKATGQGPELMSNSVTLSLSKGGNVRKVFLVMGELRDFKRIFFHSINAV